MAVTPKAANPGQFVSTSIASLYLVPAGTTALVTKVTLTNTSGSNVTVTVFMSSDNTANATARLQQITLTANQTYSVDSFAGHYIPAGGGILAQASSTPTVIMKISTVEFTS